MKKCLACSSVLTTKASKKFCAGRCQVEYQYTEYIRDWLSGKVDGSRGKFQLSLHIHRYLFEKYEYKCSLCGWNAVNPYTGKSPLEIDHIDGNPYNNHVDNLRLVCPNCHSLTSTYKALNKGRGRKDRT